MAKTKKNNGNKSYEPLTDEMLTKKIEELSNLKDTLSGNIETKLMVVTPAMAKEWLARNTKNRDSKTRGNLYARMMCDGFWDFNGQPIIISDTGLLLDGGGRLSGVVNANCPILTMVTTGVPESAFKTMDAIKARTAKDVLEASHLMEEEKTSIVGYVASMAKMHLEWLAGRYGSHGGANTRPTACSMEVQDYIEKNLQEMRECAKAGYGMIGSNSEDLMANGRYFAAFIGYLVICKGWDLPDVLTFFTELTSRHSTVRENGNPICTLRTTLSKNRLGKIKITDEERFHMFARAWNSYVLGKEVKHFDLKKNEDEPLSKEECIAKCKKKESKMEYVASMAF